MHGYELALKPARCARSKSFEALNTTKEATRQAEVKGLGTQGPDGPSLMNSLPGWVDPVILARIATGAMISSGRLSSELPS
ncbi:hypothetical protein RRG08_055125 [Elysia crispata]|uniref:Uncharacterized protein n=1 Tax=Elysia crispata TaxID=231223 RepID=A0AAE1E0K7_9GAST|nr:hypothetical protein RRG08_055125 [Elysia crispata]